MSKADIRLLERAAELLGTEVNELPNHLTKTGWSILLEWEPELGQFKATLEAGDQVLQGTSETSAQGALARAAFRLATR